MGRCGGGLLGVLNAAVAGYWAAGGERGHLFEGRADARLPTVVEVVLALVSLARYGLGLLAIFLGGLAFAPLGFGFLVGSVSYGWRTRPRCPPKLSVPADTVLHIDTGRT